MSQKPIKRRQNIREKMSDANIGDSWLFMGNERSLHPTKILLEFFSPPGDKLRIYREFLDCSLSFNINCKALASLSNSSLKAFYREKNKKNAPMFCDLLHKRGDLARVEHLLRRNIVILKRGGYFGQGDPFTILHDTRGYCHLQIATREERDSKVNNTIYILFDYKGDEKQFVLYRWENGEENLRRPPYEPMHAQRLFMLDSWRGAPRRPPYYNVTDHFGNCMFNAIMHYVSQERNSTEFYHHDHDNNLCSSLGHVMCSYVGTTLDEYVFFTLSEISHFLNCMFIFTQNSHGLPNNSRPRNAHFNEP